ncbi:MAG: GTPase HflX, partial [Solobacterium sp.]|nr:GTPase HflX [Solobacterium sp.]
SMRANSRQSQLQVEIAALRHRLSSVNESGDTEEHSRGGAARNRGAGEIRSVQLRRTYAARIRELNRQLGKLEKAADSAENRRKRSLLRRAALVGYTNSGKSSFMNAVLKRSSDSGGAVLEKDMLFATLDTSVRNVSYGMRHFLLYDTVGFVSDLPHELVESFRSTLSSVKNADLLVEIIDISDDKWTEKAEICEETLRQIGAGEIPVLRVFNKADLLKEEIACEPLISCRTGEGIDDVLSRITEMLYPEEVSFTALIPYEKGALLHRASQMVQAEILQETQEGYLVRVCGPKELSGMLGRYRIEETDEYQRTNE